MGTDRTSRSGAGASMGRTPTLVALPTPRCDSSLSPCCCRVSSAAPVSSQAFLSKVTLGRGRLSPAAAGAAALLPKWVIPGILGQSRSRSTAGRLRRKKEKRQWRKEERHLFRGEEGEGGTMGVPCCRFAHFNDFEKQERTSGLRNTMYGAGQAVKDLNSIPRT